MTTLFLAFPHLFIALTTIVGLMVGSFLNVVIYRLPVMLQRSWRKDCLEYLEMPAEQTELFEEVLVGTPEELVAKITLDTNHGRGEFVVVVEAAH